MSIKNYPEIYNGQNPRINWWNLGQVPSHLFGLKKNERNYDIICPLYRKNFPSIVPTGIIHQILFMSWIEPYIRAIAFLIAAPSFKGYYGVWPKAQI